MTAPYSPLVATLFHSLDHAGSMTSSPNVTSAEAGSRAQGAWLRLWLQRHDGRIVQARYQAYGCPHFLAGAELLANWLEGQEVEAALGWSSYEAEKALQSPAEKRGRLLLLEDALRQALRVA